MLRINNIQKRFGGLLAIEEASLLVNEGEIVALIGPNGAGKTTLFAIISGFLKPDRGAVMFKGKNLVKLQTHEICRLGIVRTFQVVQPFAHLSVRENIAVGAHNRIVKRRQALRRAEEVAELLHIPDLLDQPAASLTVAG